MIFAKPDVRRRLGLTAQPGGDPDVLAGRLRIGDPELHRILYASPRPAAEAVPAGDTADSTVVQEDSDSPVEFKSEASVIGKGTNAWSIARERYNHSGTVYVFPDGRRLRGDQIREWSKIPVGTEVLLSDGEPEQEFEGFLEIGKDGTTVRDLAGDAYADSTTIYFLPNGYIRTGAELARSSGLKRYLDAPPKGTRVLVGYVYGGYVRARRSAYYIARSKWNYPSTFYRLPDGRILSGDEVDENSIPSRTLIFFQH
jgi:hypothetical protein